MIHGERRADAACTGAGAYFPDGEYVYEKTFERPEGEHVLILFEGVYKNAKVFLNGRAEQESYPGAADRRNMP